jgi:hypothetical protein
VLRACEAHTSHYSAIAYLALTKLAELDIGPKKQEKMRRSGREGKKTCVLIRYAAILFSRSPLIRLPRWGGAAFSASAPR